LQFSREPDQNDIFRHERHFLTESAAHIRGNDAQVAFRHSEQIGNGGPHQMRHLRRAGERDPARSGVVGCKSGTAFERTCILAPRTDFNGNLPLGGFLHGGETGRL